YTNSMDPNFFEGVWEDVAAKYAKALQGHRVEIRVLDKPGAATGAREAWSAFESRVAKISSGWRIPGGRLYSAEDFYESRE
ncbi:MAG: hypothetical protein ACHQ50_08430, partial [Fimbriimonadales bacterium]